MGLPLTTNALERFHFNQQQSLHNASHPSVPVFVHDLHRQIALGDLHLAAVRAGDRRLPTALLTRKMEKFASILVSLNDHNIMMVLTQLTNVRLHTGEMVNGAFHVLSLNATNDPPSNLPSSSSAVEEGVLADRPSEVAVASSSTFEQFRAPEPLVVLEEGLPSSSVFEEEALPEGVLADRPPAVAVASFSTLEQFRAPVEPMVVQEEGVVVHAQMPVPSTQQEVIVPNHPVPPIQVSDLAGWLVQVGYTQGRHGPHNVEVLRKTIGKVTQSRLTVTANRLKGWWIFQHCQRQSICQGCRGTMCRGLPRLAWDPKTVNDEALRSYPGYFRGNWHIACGVLVSKISVPFNCLKEVDFRVVERMTGASSLDAPTIDAMANTQFVFLRSALCA